ncbi:uncharacterized protein LTHEOB_6043 [Lasiodiplodia theobromae]|nr:uncharacterized protein LTHEOB_6043 [Lasiodiplodia theobromae]KAF4544473.1 hypothetical protein LTHEOB_6043 [Lasiodiplodia theobromae]
MPPTLPLSRPLPAGAAATTSFTSTTSTTSSNAPQTLHTHTHRRSPWTYIHLRLHTTPPTTTTLDALTARQHLSAALRSYLGAHGAATAVDILRVDADSGDVWIRVPREDGAGVVAAVGGWVGSSAGGGGGEEEVRTGWVVKGWGDWLGGVVLGRGGGAGGDGGADVFGDGR